MTVALEVLIIVCAAVGITLNVGNIANMTQTEKDNTSRSIMSQLESQLDSNFFDKLKKKLFSFGILANAAITTAVVTGANGIKEQTQPISLTMDNDLVSDMKQVATGISGNTIQIKVETIESVRSAQDLYNAFLTNNLIIGKDVDSFKTRIENFYNYCENKGTLNFLSWVAYGKTPLGKYWYTYYLLASDYLYGKDYHLEFTNGENNKVFIDNDSLNSIKLSFIYYGLGYAEKNDIVKFPQISIKSEGWTSNINTTRNVADGNSFNWGVTTGVNYQDYRDFLINQTYNATKNATSNYKDSYETVGATNIVDGATKTGDLSLTIANLNDTIAKLGTTTDVVGELADTMQIAIYDKTTEKNIATDVPISDTIKEFESNIPIIAPNPNIPEYEFGSSVDSLFTMYHVTTSAQLPQLASILWDENLISQLQKWLSNPMDYIVSLQAFPISPIDGDMEEVKIGSFETNLSMKKVANQFMTYSCGSVSADKKFFNFLDTITTIDIYLPFIGIFPLNTTQVIGGKLSVDYQIDFLSGSCVANIRLIKDNQNVIIASNSGNLSAVLPLSSKDFSNVYGALIGTVGGAIGTAVGFASGNVAMGTASALGTLNNVSGFRQGVRNSGAINGNSGLLNYKKPFLIINRPIPKIPNNYGHSVGYLDNTERYLNQVSGFSKFTNVDLSSVTLTELEKDRIKQKLENGCIF